MKKVFVIAELGSSPAPDWNFAQWCEGAYVVGADAVKVQLFKAEHFPEGEQASKRPLEFPRHRTREFMDAAHAYGLQAGASVFDLEAVELVGRHCDFLKLAAREETNQSLIWATREISKARRIPVYRSISKLVHYEIAPDCITLFAIPSYPAGMVRSTIALFKAAAFFKGEGARWGWSSHTTGYADCIMAARLGAEVVEKHFCLGTANLEAGHSLLPHKFAAMVERIKR